MSGNKVLSIAGAASLFVFPTSEELIAFDAELVAPGGLAAGASIFEPPEPPSGLRGSPTECLEQQESTGFRSLKMEYLAKKLADVAFSQEPPADMPLVPNRRERRRQARKKVSK